MNEPASMRQVLAEVNDQFRLFPKVVIHFDGACEPRNPGGVATCGWTIHDSSGELLAAGHREVARGDGATNNVAEYGALEAGLRHIVDGNYNIHSLVIRGDSALVVQQVSGRWGGKVLHLLEARDRCHTLLQQITDRWGIFWVPRHQNEDADALSGSVEIPEEALTAL